MTEQEWLTSVRLHEMLKKLRPWKRQWRKFFYYIRASCSRPERWVFLKEPCIQLLQVAERFADGLADEVEYRSAKQAVTNMTRRDRREGGPNGPPLYGEALLGWLRLDHLPGWAGRNPGDETISYLDDESKRSRLEMRARGWLVITEEQAIEIQRECESFRIDHARFLRDIFGNPFHPVILNPRWLTANVVDLAHVIYAERVFDRLPILADALMDAGCDDDNIIAHCRGPGPHVRGCWVVDLLLGKE